MNEAAKKAFEDFTSRNLLFRLKVRNDGTIHCTGWSVDLNVGIHADYDTAGNLASEW